MVKEASDILRSYPEVKNVISLSGMSMMGGGNASNYGSMFVMLKPWSERKGHAQSVFEVIDRANADLAAIPEAVIFSLNPPAIPGLGNSSGLQMELLDIDNRGADALMQTLAAITAAADADPSIESVRSLYEGNVPQYRLNIDRDKIKLLGLSINSVYSTLSSYMGGTYVNDFVEFGRVYQVNIAASGAARSNIDDIRRLSVRNDKGDMVPFAAFMTIDPVMGQPTVNRYNMYQTASLTATPAKGTSSGTAIKDMEALVRQTAGTQYSYAWTGEAYQESQAGTTVTMVLLFAVIITILVLAAQYESWTDPIAVVLSMPTAILGTIVGCVFMSQSISIYTQIGIILLLGLSAKNAILIVEYAVDFRKSGIDIRQAALDAGRIRLRPIMMTALAFVFGVMPMLFATGAGAESRISLGCAVVFGMAINAIMGTLFVPNFWEFLERFRERHLSRLFASADTVAANAAKTESSQQMNQTQSPNVKPSEQNEI